MYGYGKIQPVEFVGGKDPLRRRSHGQEGHGWFAVEPSGGPTTGLPAGLSEGTGRKPSSEGTVYLSDDYFSTCGWPGDGPEERMESSCYDEWPTPPNGGRANSSQVPANTLPRAWRWRKPT